ncbi:hypothetical protein CFBP6411_04657 [Pseudomonas syringae group genomosp. 3]|uniref:Uncharacterized protein n=1 Tax=Pseudomonas syringae group genomosp. 3 TaxID=251701 RepID=A0A2K4WJK1_9PSED|nr:endodeoxyribonuclease RusA [Pseudomonas syringae group genomosp. 3]SOS36014.1 hypothetical protein CFBP6411_04657 [Pseudomonas syringae group genomosp. 3]
MSTDLILPWPPKVLSPNARTHWATKSRAAKAYRNTCYLLCRQAGLEDASSTAEGRVQVSLNKRIRKTLTVGAHVEYRNPYSEMRRLDDTHQVVQDPLVSNSALQFREAF